MPKEYITLEVGFTKEFLETFRYKFENQYVDWDDIPCEAYQVLEAIYQEYKDYKERM